MHSLKSYRYIVETGRRALTLFKSWHMTKAVVGGHSWERSSLSLFADRTWITWGFCHLQETNVLVSRLPVPVPPADLLVMFTANKAVKGRVSVGIALNASSQGEIAAALDGRTLDHGQQHRVDRLAEVLDQDRVAVLERALELAQHVALREPHDLQVAARV